jgi:hypothetical protein
VILSRNFLEISQKVEKSLIAPLPAGRQGLSNDYTDYKCIEKQGEICGIIL